MGVTRVGNFAVHNRTLSDMADVQKRLATLQEQISSGFKADTFAGLSGQVEQFTLLQTKMRTAQQHIDTNQVNIARMKTTDNALGAMVDIADQMENLMVTARGPLKEGLNFEQNMKNMLNNLGTQLNVNFEGRYLLGGTNTAQPPVPDPLYKPVVEGVPDSGYYAGSSSSLSFRQDERISYEFPVRADDPAFQKIMAAAQQAITAFNNSDDEALAEAVSLIQQGQQDLVTARGRLNNTIVNVESTNEQLTSLNLYLKGVTEEVSKTDLVAASTEVANNETILQAAFSVFATLSQLKLSDYLR